MITAPHGLELFRGGAFGEKVRVHYRERWVSELCLKLSQAVAKKLGGLMSSTSFMVWNCATAVKQDVANLDPNYLIEPDFAASPWHSTLKAWKAAFAETNIPLLHIDLHGKLDRKENLNIDVGVGAMEELWRDKPIVAKLKKAINKELTKALEGRRQYGYKQLRMGVEKDPSLRGYNNRGFHTMAHQSVLLGVPAVQLELPRTVRKALLVENVLFDKFADAIAQTYMQVFGARELSLEEVPAHYPGSFRRAIEEKAEEAETPVAADRLAAKKKQKAGYAAGSAAAYAATVTPPQPVKLTRSAVMCKQMLAELDRFEASCSDKMI